MKLSFIFELLLVFVLIAFAASAVIDKQSHRGSRKTTVKKNGKVSNKRQSTSSVNKYCSCSANLCNCCREFNIAVVSLRGPGCASLQYLKGDRLAISMSFGERVLTNTTISSKKPQPVCMPLPGGVSKFCGRVYNIARKGEDFNACLGLELRALQNVEAALRVSCFRFGPKGLRVEPSQPLPVVDEDDDENDDDDEDDDDDDEDDDDEFDFDDDDSENDIDSDDYGTFSVFDDDFIGEYFQGGDDDDDDTPAADTVVKQKKKPVATTTTRAPLRRITTRAPIRKNKVTTKRPANPLTLNKVVTSTTVSTTSSKLPAKLPTSTEQVTSTANPMLINVHADNLTMSVDESMNGLSWEGSENALNVNNDSITVQSLDKISGMNITEQQTTVMEMITEKLVDTTTDIITEQQTETTEQSLIIKGDEDSDEESDEDEDPISEAVEEALEDDDDSNEVTEKPISLTTTNTAVNNNVTTKKDDDEKEGKGVLDDIVDGVVGTFDDEDDEEANDDDDDDDDDDESPENDESEEDDEDDDDEFRSLKKRKVVGRQSRDMWLDRLHW